MAKEDRRNTNLATINAARNWGDPKALLRVEKEKHPFQRALGVIVGDVFSQHVPHGATVFEVGAGQGFLKDLVPSTYRYQNKYISSDYHAGNLHAGKQRRELLAVAASATHLPLPAASVDVVTGMDSYDTLPRLQDAMDEAYRVLRPGGTFIHFQATVPEETVWFDHPDMIFFPTGRGNRRGPQMIGIKRNILERVQEFPPTYLAPEFDSLRRDVIDDFLTAPGETYHEIVKSDQIGEASDVLELILDTLPVDKLEVPNVHSYFQNKLYRTASNAGLEVVESNFRGANVSVSRSESQNAYPEANTFRLNAGSYSHYQHPWLAQSEFQGVMENANLLVVVAKKPR